MNNLCFVNSKLDRVSVRPPLVAPMRLLLLLLDTPATKRERKREITELKVRLKVWLAFRKAGEKRERERQGNEIMMAAGGGGGVCVFGGKEAIERQSKRKTLLRQLNQRGGLCFHFFSLLRRGFQLCC